MASNKLIFATGNRRKIAEAELVLGKFSIGFEPTPVTIDEIQHHDPKEITKAKARAAYDTLKCPVVVQDTSWSIPALNGFPGGYMKDVAEWWQAEDWMSIMARYDDRTISCHEHIAYFDGEDMRHFEASYMAGFVDEPRGSSAGNNSLDQSVTINGIKTLAELHDRGELASDIDGCEHWRLFAEWFSNK